MYDKRDHFNFEMISFEFEVLISHLLMEMHIAPPPLLWCIYIIA